MLPRCDKCEGTMVPESSAAIPQESGAHVWLQCHRCNITREYITRGDGELEPTSSAWPILLGLIAFVFVGLAYALFRQ